MVKRLQPIGHSFGVIIDRPLLEVLGINRDTLIEISTDGKALTLRPVDESSHKARVRKSTARMSKIHHETFEKLAE
jgi:antitoxin MazE